MTKRRRATCIVELPNEHGECCVLIAEQRGSSYDLLPGGRVERGEAPIIAAIRELREETELKTQGVIKLFEYTSAHQVHHVFYLIPEPGQMPRPHSDVKRLWKLRFAELGDLSSHSSLSRSTVQILSAYRAWREQHEALLDLEVSLF